MRAPRRDIIAHPRGSAIPPRGATAPTPTHAHAQQEPPTRLVALRRHAVATGTPGLVSDRDFRDIVTTRFEYPPVAREEADWSESLVAAFTPYSAKGRSLRYLAARLLLEAASERSLCFAVAGAERKCGVTFVAANLAVAFSEFGLRTLLIDANQRHPALHQLFDCSQEEGLSTLTDSDDGPDAHVVRLAHFRDLSLLPAGAPRTRRKRRPIDELLAHRLRRVRDDYDIVICDSPARTVRGDDCAVVAGICGNALAVFRRNQTRVASARVLLSSLDAVGARPMGSVLCDT